MRETEVVVVVSHSEEEEEVEDEQTSIKQQFNVTDAIDLAISSMSVPLGIRSHCMQSLMRRRRCF